ncbi:hypothetical protein D3C79_1099430 [compost metagenome]
MRSRTGACASNADDFKATGNPARPFKYDKSSPNCLSAGNKAAPNAGFLFKLVVTIKSAMLPAVTKS